MSLDWTYSCIKTGDKWS